MTFFSQSQSRIMRPKPEIDFPRVAEIDKTVRNLIIDTIVSKDFKKYPPRKLIARIHDEHVYDDDPVPGWGAAVKRVLTALNDARKKPFVLLTKMELDVLMRARDFAVTTYGRDGIAQFDKFLIRLLGSDFVSAWHLGTLASMYGSGRNRIMGNQIKFVTFDECTQDFTTLTKENDK